MDYIVEAKYSSPVITVKPESSIHETLSAMQQNFIKRIVVAIKNKPIGIVTERDVSKFLENEKTAKALNEIPINHVMKKDPIVLADGFEDHYEQCATRMETFNIGAVILVDDEGQIIGIVTKTDITKAYSTIHGGKFLVKDYMTEKLITCRESDSLRYALNMINSNDVSRLVVTDNNGNPIGIITTNTFLKHSSYFANEKTKTSDYLLPTKKEENLTVKEFVQSDILCLNLHDDLAFAAKNMINSEVSGVPVINSEKKLVGIITKSDIVRAFSHANLNEKLKIKYKKSY